MTAATAPTHRCAARSLARWLAYLWTIGSACTAPHPTISTILTASSSPTLATNGIAERAAIPLAQQALHNDRNRNVHHAETKTPHEQPRFRPDDRPSGPALPEDDTASSAPSTSSFVTSPAPVQRYLPTGRQPVTVIDTALHTSLRTLKLSGMLDTLDARLAQARAGELGHLDFLQTLCQDEITRRDTMSMARRLRRAHFDEQTTIEGFDFAASPKLPAAAIRDLAALRWLHAGESVILHGPVGVGKTHVAQALGHLAIRHGAEVRFLKTSRALAHLAGGHADRTWPRRLAELARPDLLILDDFALRELSLNPPTGCWVRPS